MHDEFLCHVTAYGVCGGRWVGVPLGTYRAPTLPLALWWLRDRALWIAARLDPLPETAAFPEGSLTPVGSDTADVPAVLRDWCHDTYRQDRVAEELSQGRLMRFSAQDETTEYELMAESVDTLRMRRMRDPYAMSAGAARR
ncbi:hypothetical protein ACIP88_22700 [Streptomyces uncialis]|uniref:hypothetical protein n=1 Tax=Streptomyces uncialis TaxID=1048205 RepID=UPI003808AA11